MKFNILTLFPDMFAPLFQSMIGRAVERNLIDINLINIRDFSADKHNKADDYSFGGGAGMVMLPQPLFDALDSIDGKNKKVIYMSPRGKVMDMEYIFNLSKEEEVVIICGHYEGIDQRVLDYFHAEEVSIGDYVLTGGELPAMILIDATSRLIPNVLKSDESAIGESIYSGLLEYPQYTKPRVFRDLQVPDVLLSGNHQLIDLWRYEQSLRLTKERRPDIFLKYVNNHEKLTKSHQKVLENIMNML